MFYIFLIVFDKSSVIEKCIQSFASSAQDYFLIWDWAWVSFQYWRPRPENTMPVNVLFLRI
jgi:hypothetical protein